MRYQHIVQAVYETPWAIMPDTLATILAILHERASGYTPTAEEVRARLDLHRVVHQGPLASDWEDYGEDQPEAASGSVQRVSGSVAVLPVLGILSQRGGMTDTSEMLTSTAALGKAFRALVADETVGAIVLDVDSPGGSVFGVEELAAEIFKARGSKPIVAVSNSLMASAAYWIGTAAEEVVITPSGMAGSIGVILAHDDISAAMEKAGVKVSLITAGKYKSEGSPYEPLTDEARAAMQDMVNGYYDSFVSGVAKNRGAKVADVRGGFGEGRVLGAKEALAAGMVDRIDTMDNVIGGLMKAKRPSGNRAEGGLQLKRRRMELHAMR